MYIKMTLQEQINTLITSNNGNTCEMRKWAEPPSLGVFAWNKIRLLGWVWMTKKNTEHFAWSTKKNSSG